MIWLVFAFFALTVFVAVVAFRLLAIARLPVHLRWEIAPVPGERGKGRYGGSPFEEHEWWRKPRRRSWVAPIVYMAKEILFLRGVWVHQRSLWPFTYGLHLGLYLIICAMLLITLANAVVLLFGSGTSVPDVVNAIGASLASLGYILGGLGTTGLLLMRIFDGRLRSLSSVSTYANLVFLLLVFASGGYVSVSSNCSIADANAFARGLMTAESDLKVAFPLSLHFMLLLLFILYVPWTNMVHFVAKYFMYHAVRWDDEPQNPDTARAVGRQLCRPVAWSADHVKGNGGTNWMDIIAEHHDEKAP